MFAQVFQGRTSDAEAFRAGIDRWNRELAPGSIGWLGSTEGVSVVGFDNTPEAALSVPALTTVEQPIHDMGRLAIDMVVNLIRGEPVEKTHVTLATKLVVRQSTMEWKPA